MAGRPRLKAAASPGLGVEIPPFHAEGFGPIFGFLSILTKCQNRGQTLCMGWGFWPVLVILAKWPKFAACLTCVGQSLSDTQRALVILSKNEPKLAAYLAKCRGSVPTPSGVGRLATSLVAGGIRHGTRVKPIPSGGRSGSVSDTQRVLGKISDFDLGLVACLRSSALACARAVILLGSRA